MGAARFATGDVILGIDPGVESLGWGVAIIAPDGKLYHKAHGCETTQAAQTMPDRVDAQARAVKALVEKFKPAAIAVEAWVPYRGGSRGAGENTMRVCGVVRALGVFYGLPVVEYTAQAVKGLLLGQRNAEKKDVQKAVQTYLALTKLPRPNHAADALACAIVHFTTQAPSGAVVSKSAHRAPATPSRGKAAAGVDLAALLGTKKQRTN